MSSWFDRAFETLGDAIGEARHELLGGWFGRTFEPHPSHSAAASEDIAHEQSARGQEHDIGIER